jgi:hypothetical protein
MRLLKIEIEIEIEMEKECERDPPMASTSSKKIIHAFF